MKQYWWILCLAMLGCEQTKINKAWEKDLIIKTLKKETQYFCERNLANWQEQWSHEPFVSKMYGGSHEFEWFNNWESINQFTVDHITQNPESIPIPESNFDYVIHLFGETAWVFFSKNVNGQKVQETRFMVKEKGQWRIARMQTIF